MNLLKVLTIVIAVFFSTEQLPAQERQPVEYVNPYIGTVNAAIVVGVLAIGVAFWGLNNLEETFHKDLDYTE